MYERFLTLFIFLILVFGCKDIKSQSPFFEMTNERWSYAIGISWLSPHFEQDLPIKKPEKSWQPIMKIDFLDANFNEVSDCLFYFIPSEKLKGILKVVANPKNLDCHELLGDSGYIEFKDIYNFGYNYESNYQTEFNLVLKIDTNRFKYNFLNLTNGKRERKLLANGSLTSKVSGVQVASPIAYDTQVKILKEGEICFNVNDQCEVTSPDLCEQCSGASYNVVASACPNKFRRICGIDECGKSNQPACFRGFRTSGINPQNYCITDSPAGLCEKGLRVVCINNVLMCE